MAATVFITGSPKLELSFTLLRKFAGFTIEIPLFTAHQYVLLIVIMIGQLFTKSPLKTKKCFTYK